MYLTESPNVPNSYMMVLDKSELKFFGLALENLSFSVFDHVGQRVDNMTRKAVIALYNDLWTQCQNLALDKIESEFYNGDNDCTE